VWDRDAQGTLQAEKLYLMHVALVDALVGRLLDRLRQGALLDEALLVVTSDHGQTFRPGHSHRVADAETRSDLLPIAFLLKAPGQREGRIDDTPLESIDVLPTLAVALGAEPPWPLEGRAPAEGGRRAERLVQRRSGRIALPVDPAPWRAALERKLATFGSGTPSEELLRAGPLPELVGAAAGELAAEESAPYAFALHDAGLYEAVDPEAHMVPAFVHGWLRADPGAEGRSPLLAVAIEGRVAAVTSAFAGPDGTLRFQALVPESAFKPGRNRVELFLPRKEGGRVRLLRVRPLAD
jgi:predicted AlkP superfamily pyrophosphatase or phosphodiesterase